MRRIPYYNTSQFNLKEMETAKTILAIIGLLAIGFIAGFWFHRGVVHKKVERIVRLGEGPVFQERLIERLDPRPDQVAELEEILHDHALEMGKMMRRTRAQRQELLMDLEDKLHPVLDSVQMEKLHQFHRRLKTRMQPGQPGAHHRKRRHEMPHDSIH